MENNLKMFNSDKFGEIRTMKIRGKDYFVAKDIAIALGYKDTTNAIKLHCRGVVKHHLIDSIGRKQVANVIPEGDIYRLVTHSKLPSAQEFESWIFDEVLPTIRKTGTYSTKPQQQSLEPAFTPAVRTYRGRRVVTIQDIAKTTGKPESTIQYYIRSKKAKCKEGTDFHILRGDELRNFKQENNMNMHNLGVLTVVLESGFVKLCKHFGILPNSTGYFLIDKPKPPKDSLTPEALPAEILLRFEKTKKALIALDVALDVYKQPSNFRKKSQSGIDALQSLAVNVLMQATQILHGYDELQIQS